MINWFTQKEKELNQTFPIWVPKDLYERIEEEKEFVKKKGMTKKL